MPKNIGAYSKFIVAVLGAVASSLATYYPSRPWVPVVLSVCAAVSVLLVPNQPQPPAAA